MGEVSIDVELVEVEAVAGTAYATFAKPSDPHSPIRLPVTITQARELGAALFETFTLTVGRKIGERKR